MRNGCVFCDYQGPSPILLTTPDCIVFEPLAPCTPGHLLVVPTTHVEGMGDSLAVASEVSMAVFLALRHFKLAKRCNVIVNDGSVAGQTVNHLHVHLVPREHGDGLKLPWSGQESA